MAISYSSRWTIESLETIGMPANYKHTLKQLSEGAAGRVLRRFGCFRFSFGSEGFEDVLPKTALGKDRRLGEGLYYNTGGSISQLALALSVVNKPVIDDILSETKGKGSATTVRELRKEQVLKGIKILDLGCGEVPSFALAAKSLGAEIHTADGRDLNDGVKSMLDSHSVTDLTSPTAICNIVENAGLDFNIVSENIVGSVPEAPGFQVPNPASIRLLGSGLLANGGYLHEAPKNLFYKPMG